MNEINIINDKDNNSSLIISKNPSKIFKDENNIYSQLEYIEIKEKDYKFIKIIFRTQGEINAKNSSLNEILGEKINQFQKIILIIDFQSLSEELETDELKQLIYKFYKSINNDNTKIDIIIQNSYINPDKTLAQISSEDKLVLNKLELSDELYGLSSYANYDYLFPSLKVNELVLKKFKFNSKDQISRFFKFIIRVDCKILTLEDIFIELIIKNDENDSEYKDLDRYITFVDGVITLDGNHTNINTLIMRECPLFAIIGNMFTYKEIKDNNIIYKNIDIDEISLINKSIITKFKIEDNKFDICFDLDSYKLKLEDDGLDKYDYIDYLDYIFNIIISFTRKGQKIIEDKNKDEDDEDEDEDGVGNIYRKNFHKLIFKNFDTTKLEYITDDDITFIEEKNWILDKKEKQQKQRWEELEKDLLAFDYEPLSNVKELVFDNCSNFFIKWILNFVIGKNIKKSANNDLELLKIKKCGKDYIDLSNILKMKIKKLILFDAPLIIGDNFPEDHLYLNKIEANLGKVEYLILKNNALDSYGKENNLNTYKTYEILVELIKKENFNKNITFEYKALSNIMTYLAYREYLPKQEFYNNPNDEEEDGEDKLKDVIKGNIDKNSFLKEGTTLPNHFFYSSKKYRDHNCFNAFNLNALGNSEITLKNITIKRTTENFDNNNYLMKKKGDNSKNYTDSNSLKKLDFGNDGFYIDRDYKIFISLNKIKTISLENVTFSNNKDNNLKRFEEEPIINLMSDNENEVIKNFGKTFFPNYAIDANTLNGFLFKNFLFEDIGIMFKYFLYKVNNEKKENIIVSQDVYDKKLTLMDYFKKLVKIFDCFKKNIKQLTIIINNIKELKEIYCTLSVLEIVVEEKEWKNEEVKISGKSFPSIQLPKISLIEKRIGAYFLKEKNEEDKNVYSEMNYYYTSKGEEKMLNDKKYTINDYNIIIECKFDINKENV